MGRFAGKGSKEVGCELEGDSVSGCMCAGVYQDG